MRVSTSITTDELAAIPERAQALEAAGFDGVATQENRHEPFIPLTLAASVTERVRLTTNVAIAFPRSPMVAAQTAWDLQALSEGRFVLGLGSQIRPHIERRFSTEWRAPAAKMREYIGAIRAIHDCWQNGERLAFEGDHYTFSLMTPNFTPPPLKTAPPALMIGAVGPLMMKLAGEVCDGIMLHGFCTREYLRTVILPRLDAALESSGRSRTDFEVSGGGFVATGSTDEEVAAATEVIRQRVGFYASTPAYWPVLEIHNLQELGHELNTMSKAGEWDAMTGRIDDDVLDLFCARGRHDQIAAAIGERFGGLTDWVSLDPSTPASVIAEVQAVP